MRNNKNLIWTVLGFFLMFFIAFISYYYSPSTLAFWLISILAVIVCILLGSFLSREKSEY